MILAGNFKQGAAEVFDYRIDWTLDEGDSVATASWRAQDITVGSGAFAPVTTASSTTVWLSGGSPSRPGLATVTVTTAAGRVVERTIQIEVV